MADGILSAIENVLGSPAAQTLLPTLAGALGGALTSRRLAGGGAAVGNALLGGVQGYESGQRARSDQAILQHNQLENQIATYNIHALQQAQKGVEQDRKNYPDLSAQFPDDAQFEQAKNQKIALPGMILQFRAAQQNPDPGLAPFTARMKGQDPTKMDFDELHQALHAYWDYKEPKPATENFEERAYEQARVQNPNLTPEQFHQEWAKRQAAPERPQIVMVDGKPYQVSPSALPALPSGATGVTKPGADSSGGSALSRAATEYLKLKAARDKMIGDLGPLASTPEGLKEAGITPLPPFKDWLNTPEGQAFLGKAPSEGAPSAPSASPAPAPPAGTASASGSSGLAPPKGVPATVETPHGRGKYDPALSRRAGHPVWVTSDGSVFRAKKGKAG